MEVFDADAGVGAGASLVDGWAKGIGNQFSPLMVI